MDSRVIVVAGATGDLGGRIAKALRARQVDVVALVRPGQQNAQTKALEAMGAQVKEVDLRDSAAVAAACAGASCVVSALSGLREVVVETQRSLLEGAVQAGVPRFIPSDYSMDYTRLPIGENRNLDLRREFASLLNEAPIRATSVFTGAFMDLLSGQAPIVLFRIRRVLYWGDPDTPVDFTTKDDAAAFTAATALDEEAPRALTIAGDTLSARQLTALMTDLSGRQYKLLRAGSLRRLKLVIRLVRALTPRSTALYPVWQGMQYVHGMFSGLTKQGQRLDNERYPGMQWTKAREVLAGRVGS